MVRRLRRRARARAVTAFVASGRPGRWSGSATLAAGVLGAILALPPVPFLSAAAVSVASASVAVVVPRLSARLTARGLVTGRTRVLAVASGQVGAVGALAGLGAGGLLLWIVLLGAAWLLAVDTTGDVPQVPCEAPPDATPGQMLQWSCSEVAGWDEAPGPGERGAGPAGLSDSELCRAWRSSYLEVTSAAGDPDGLYRVSCARRAYLDEMQRRDPGGFATWMGAGARAAGDPAQYWTGRA